MTAGDQSAWAFGGTRGSRVSGFSPPSIFLVLSAGGCREFYRESEEQRAFFCAEKNGTRCRQVVRTQGRCMGAEPRLKENIDSFFFPAGLSGGTKILFFAGG